MTVIAIIFLTNPTLCMKDCLTDKSFRKPESAAVLIFMLYYRPGLAIRGPVCCWQRAFGPYINLSSLTHRVNRPAAVALAPDSAQVSKPYKPSSCSCFKCVLLPLVGVTGTGAYPGTTRARQAWDSFLDCWEDSTTDLIPFGCVDVVASFVMPCTWWYLHFPCVPAKLAHPHNPCFLFVRI